MPAQPKKTEYIALTNFSVGSVVRYANEVERNAKLYKRGDRVPLTEDEYEQNKRWVRPVTDADVPPSRDLTAREVVGKLDTPTRAMVDASLKNTGALPISDKTSVIGQIDGQAETVSPQPQDQPSTNI